VSLETLKRRKMKLITIVHAQKIEYIPIIYEFLHNVKYHVLIFDYSDSVYAYELKKSLDKLNFVHKVESEILLMEIDEDSKQDMQKFSNVFKNENVKMFLNGSGADTALFTVLSSIILSQNGEVVAYDKEDNTYNLINKEGFLNKLITNNMNIEDFLTLMGEELIEETSTEKIMERKEGLELLFSDTKRMFKVRNLLKKRKTKELKTRYAKIIIALKELMLVDKDDLLNGEGSFTRFGTLFEEFVYLQLEVFKFDDVKVGAKIRFDKTQVERHKIEITNEFDILTIYKNKIGFIECKIGDSSDPLGTIYKSDSVMEYFGESASSMIVNIERDKTPHLKKSKRNFGHSLLYRAKTKKITVYNAFDFSKPTFRNKVTQAFGIALKKELQKENSKEQMSQF
jgi:hypothetical protein